jgi:endonuclease/exonuclease/phosphatase (EEP) superfamily protein YafD
MKFRHADGAGGVAILSKQPFEQVFYGRCVGIYPGWIVRAGSPIGPVQLAVLHLHPPMADMTIDTPYQRDELPQVRLCELQSYVRKLDADKATIVCGDFNTDDGGPALKWLASQGYTNALDRDPYTATWRGRRGLVPVRMRLDHIFAGPWLRCLHGRALHAGGSDHRPLLGRFERRSAGVRSR